MEKKEQIKKLVLELLEESNQAILKKLDRILNSSAIDIDNWSSEHNPMILPKCITIALLENEATSYECKGTSHEKHVKQEVNNIKLFL